MYIYIYIYIYCYILIMLLSFLLLLLYLVTSIYVYIYIYKLAWVGFEPTTTEFRSYALSDWAIRPWVQPALRANFVQTRQFHCLFSVLFQFGCLLSSRLMMKNKWFIQNLKCPVINRQLNKFTKPGIVMLSYCVDLTSVYGITVGKFALISVSASVCYFSSFV